MLKASATDLLSDASPNSCKRLCRTRRRTASVESTAGICGADEDSGKQPQAKRAKRQQNPACKVYSKRTRIHLTKTKKGKRKAMKQKAKSNAVELDNVQCPLPDDQPNTTKTKKGNRKAPKRETKSNDLELDNVQFPLLDDQPNNFMEQPLTPFTSNDDDDGDNDGLPRFEFIPDEKLKESNLIWVKHGKDPPWPAVALKLINRRKKLHKVRVGFIEYDENNRLKHKPMSLKYDSKRMQPISKDYAARKNGQMTDSMSKRFKTAIEKVEKFLFSSNQPKLKAEDFFGMTEAYCAKTKSEDEDEGDDNLDMTALPFSAKSNDGPGGIESKVEPEDDEDEIEVIDTRPSYSKDTYRLINERQRQEEELVDVIKTSNDVKEHLESVLFGRKDSVFQTAFQKPGKTGGDYRALRTLGFGPVENELYIDELIGFLQNHLCKLKQRTKESDDIYYLTDVWLPEAIIFGIHLQRNVELEEAQQIFARGVLYTPEEMASFVDDMIANTTDEDRNEQRTRMKRNLSNKALGVV